MKSFAKIGALALTIAAGTAVQAMEDAVAPAPAAAATAPSSIRAGAILSTADGKQLGRIDRVLNGTDGKAAFVSLIFDSRFVRVPASTLTSSEKGYVTSLTKAEVRKLK